jgi:hypothetical protein
VGGIVVEDQMQIEMGGDLAIDLLEEGQELVCWPCHIVGWLAVP